MQLFERLQTERGQGFSIPGPIPHSAIAREALRLGLDEDGLHEMWYVIHALDDQERAVMAKAASPGAGAGSGGLQDKNSGRSIRRGGRKPKGDVSS